MFRARSLLVAALLLPLMNLGGCASSKTSALWASPALTPETHRSIAVVAVDTTGRLAPDSGMLINVENRIVAELGSRGYETTLQSDFRHYLDNETLRATGLTETDYSEVARLADADAILIARVTALDTRPATMLFPFSLGGRQPEMFTTKAAVSLRMIDARSGDAIFTVNGSGEQTVPDMNTLGTVVDDATAASASKIPVRLASVTIDTTPSIAGVTVDGAPKGSTPLTLQLPPGKPVQLELNAAGYEPVTLLYTPVHNDRVRRTLKASPLAAR